MALSARASAWRCISTAADCAFLTEPFSGELVGATSGRGAASDEPYGAQSAAVDCSATWAATVTVFDRPRAEPEGLKSPDALKLPC